MDPKKAQKLGRDLQSGLAGIKEALASERIEGSAGGGALRVVVNGSQDVLEVRIAREAVDPDDVQMLEDLVKAAVNQAMARAREVQQARTAALTGGMKLPDLPFF